MKGLNQNLAANVSASTFQRAFTLIELMIVVALIGLMAAMGIPSLMSSLQKEGMRKAVSDIQDVLSTARAQAILSDQTVSVIFHPQSQDRTFAVEGASPSPGDDNSSSGSILTKTPSSGKMTSGVLPDGIEFAMVDINQMDFSESDTARVRFFPDGTCDEMTLALIGKARRVMITLEFSTGIATIKDISQ